MDERDDLLRFASTVTFLFGLFQGVVPLVLRLVFDVDRQFSLALLLPSPWWWIACVAIIVACLFLLETIDQASERRRGADR